MSHPSEHPDVPMTPDELQVVIPDPVAREAMLMLGDPLPTWNQWVEMWTKVTEFNRRQGR